MTIVFSWRSWFRRDDKRIIKEEQEYEAQRERREKGMEVMKFAATQTPSRKDGSVVKRKLKIVVIGETRSGKSTIAQAIQKYLEEILNTRVVLKDEPDERPFSLEVMRRIMDMGDFDITVETKQAVRRERDDW